MEYITSTTFETFLLWYIFNKIKEKIIFNYILWHLQSQSFCDSGVVYVTNDVYKITKNIFGKYFPHLFQCSYNIH